MNTDIKTTRLVSIFMLILACIVIQSCKLHTDITQDVTGTWVMQSVYVGASTIECYPLGLYISTDTEAGKNKIQISGESSVNYFGGSATLHQCVFNGRIRAKTHNSFYMTKMAGPQDLAEFEDIYLSVFGKSFFMQTQTTAQGEKLIISNKIGLNKKIVVEYLKASD